MKRRDLALENEERPEGIFNFATGCPICEKKESQLFFVSLSLEGCGEMETDEITVLFTIDCLQDTLPEKKRKRDDC